MAAMVSALLEAAELDVAERIEKSDHVARLIDLGAEAELLWHGAPRDPFAVRLDPALSRAWLAGRCLSSGRTFPVPFDLVSLDFTVRPQVDAHGSSSGLASGNTAAEAATGAVAELLERDLMSLFDGASPVERRASEVDLCSIDHPLLERLLRRVADAGFDVRLWSMGQQLRIAAIRCAIVARVDNPSLPPTVGSGCHPNRLFATLRAVLEAIQVHATLVAGARDDLCQHHYDDPGARKLDMILSTLSFDRGKLDWVSVPDHAVRHQEAVLEALLRAVQARSTLPIIGIEHDSGIDGISVFRAIAPGLADPGRVNTLTNVTVRRTRIEIRRRAPVVFIGPTLDDRPVPPGIEQRPPAICGDLAMLLQDPPIAVGLVDGCFATQPSVWHKEILDLIGHGIPVFGAASLGALRAAELHCFGMVGIGCIFEGYREGRIVRDDAVMVMHAPAELGWRPLTISLVDAEAAIWAMPLAASDRRMLLRIARTTPYAARTWSGCLAAFAARTGRAPPPDVAKFDAQPSVKRADAELLFDLLLSYRPPETVSSTPRLPPLTAGYARLLAEISAKQP